MQITNILCPSTDSMDNFSRSDIDLDDVEALKYVTSVPVPNRHRNRKYSIKNRQNQNAFSGMKQSRARPLKTHEVWILLIFPLKVPLWFFVDRKFKID